MLRGLYEFRPINEKTLGFQMNDLLLFLEPHARDKNWLRVADCNGHFGFVPINFIEVHRETTSDTLLSFLDEAIRRARRDRLGTVELLNSVRQNIMTSPFTTDEHMAQIDREVGQLRARAISELNTEEDYRRACKSKEKQSSPRPGYSVEGKVEDQPDTCCNHSRFHTADLDFVSNATTVGGGSKPSLDHGYVLGDQLKQHKSRKKYKKQVDPLSSGSTTQYAEIRITSGGDTPRVFDPSSAIVLTQEPPFDHADSCIYDQIEPKGNLELCSNVSRMPLQPEPPSFMESATMGAQIVDIVRNTTGLSHRLSQDAVQVVLQYVSENIAGMPENVTKLMVHLESPRAVSQNPAVIARSPDAHNIRKIFYRLTECKDDEQQRSWALHEDESMIIDNLKNLHSILINADASIPQFVMQSDRYNSVNALVLFYQMEVRWSIRAKLVDCFSVMCSIDPQALSVLVNSILPMELAREIRGSESNPERMCLCVNLLVMLLCTGESIPTTHFDILGADFVEFVFNIVENPPNQDEKITDGFMNLLFAYNLQFETTKDNLIMTTLEEKLNANVFTQKLIFFLNREVDPIDLFEHPRETKNSVLKMATDVFSSKRASDLFYTNDIKVLIDIVTRCVTDLGPGDERRTSYLRLMQNIVRNSNFPDHRHRLEDLHNCFMSILLEEDNLSVPDQRIIKEIASEFPVLFKTE